MELSLSEIFGDGATQDASTLIIQKADLPKLSTNQDNRAEQLLVALILKAIPIFQGELVDENDDYIVDSDFNKINYDNSELYKLVVNHWRVRVQDRKIINQFVIHTYETN